MKKLIFSLLLLLFTSFLQAEEQKDVVLWMTEDELKACYENKEKTEQRFLIRENGKVGFIDGCGRVIVKPIYDLAFEFSDGAARVEKDGKASYIDKSGKALNISTGKYNGFKIMNFYFKKYKGEAPREKPCEYSNHLLCRGKTFFLFYDYSGQKFQPSIIETLFPESEEAKIPSVWDEIDRWKKMDAEEEVKKLTKTNIRKCDDGITIKETLTADGFRETTTIYDKNNKIIRSGDMTAWCPKGNLMIYREKGKDYVYDLKKQKVVFDIPALNVIKDIYTELSIFEDKLIITEPFGPDEHTKLISADGKKIFLKINPSGCFYLFKTANGNIRILEWQGKIYYLNKNYKAFWSGKYDGNILERE